MCCPCVRQCKEDTQRHWRGRICRLLCHWKSPHRLALLSTLPPLSSATHSPPALAQLLPMLHLCDGTLSNHWTGRLFVLSACTNLLQVVFQHQCTAADVRWCMHGSRSIFGMPALHSRFYRLVAEGEAYLLGDVGEG